MAAAFLWGGIGVLILFILIGFVAGLIRGLKRSALHIIFFVVSFVIAFFITKPITSAILGIPVVINGTQSTLNDIIYTFLKQQFDLSNFQAVGDFAKTLPLSVASPIAFIIISIVTFLLFDLIYLIVAHFVFGRKKETEPQKKSLRWYGSAVGAVEGFLFLFLLFAPLTSLTQTYESLATYSAAQTSQAAYVISEAEAQDSSTLPLLPELLEQYVPKQVDEAIREFNKSVVGKVSGAGGLNHALFDFLSSSKVNDEKIHLRKDLLAASDAYNEFAVAYNAFTAKDYETLDASVTTLKASLSNFLDEGIFRGVLAPTVKDFVVKFEVESAPDFIRDNQLLSDLVVELKEAFSKPDFEIKSYLKDDLLKLVDIAKAVADSGIVEEFENLDTNDMMAILKTISQNTDKFKTVIENASGLHILSDGFDAIGKFASQKMSEFFDNADIKLNLESPDKVELITNTFDALSNVLEATSQLDFSKILEGDLMGGIEGVEKIDQVLINIGKAFDGIRNLDILVHPSEEPEGKNTYVLDEILKKYKFALVTGYTVPGVDEKEEVKYDVVHALVENADGTVEEKELTIDSYENFCTAIARPVKLAQELELFHLGTEGSNFEEILGKVLNKMHEMSETQTGAQTQSAEDAKESGLLSQILLPFFELEHEMFNNNDEQISVRDLIFDNIVQNLNNNIQQIDLSDAISTEDYTNWKQVFDDMGSTLLILDDMNEEHMIVVEEKSYTYIRYMLSEGSDFKKLLDSVVEDGTLKEILKSLLSSSVFDPLVDDIFDQLDKTIESLTKVAPEKMEERKSLLEGKEEQVAAIFEELVNFANANTSLENINLAEVGELLDSLKAGAKDGGIFKGVFENLIWYLTGDTTINEYYTDKSTTTFEQASTVKAYLNITDYYADDVSYAEKFAELQDVREFAESLKTKDLQSLKIEGSSADEIKQSVETFLQSFDEILKDMENNGKDAEAQAKVIQNISKYKKAANDQTTFLTEDQKSNSTLTDAIKEKVKGKYNTEEGTDSNLTKAILEMLGLSEAA